MPNRGKFFDDPGLLDDFIIMYLDGVNDCALARHFGLDRTTLLHRARALGIWTPRRTLEPRMWHHRPVFEEMLSEMFVRYLDGESPEALAPHFGVTSVTIYAHLRKHGITSYRQRGRKPGSKKSPPQFEPSFEPIEKGPKLYKYQHLFDEPVRKPKSYSDIYNAALKRGDRSLAYAAPPPQKAGIVGPDLHT